MTKSQRAASEALAARIALRNETASALREWESATFQNEPADRPVFVASTSCALVVNCGHTSSAALPGHAWNGRVHNATYMRREEAELTASLCGPGWTVMTGAELRDRTVASLRAALAALA